jgi:hypothetical protein
MKLIIFQSDGLYKESAQTISVPTPHGSVNHTLRFDAEIHEIIDARPPKKPGARWNRNRLDWDYPEPPPPDKPVPDDPVQLPPNPAEAKLSEYGEVGSDPVEEEITTDHLLTDMKKDALATQEVIAKLSRDKRRRFTELLNVEKAELRNKAKATGVSDAREADVDRLLNLFARVGEA